MDKMLAFIQAQPFECLVDYECCALHVLHDPYDLDKHEDYYPNINYTNHALTEYVD
jgi:hypothetical protein